MNTKKVLFVIRKTLVPRLHEVKEAIVINPGEMLRPGFWSKFEYSQLDRTLPTHDRLTFSIRFLLVSCLPLSIYLFLKDLSIAGWYRNEVIPVGVAGVFFIGCFFVWKYERDKRSYRRMQL